MAETLATRYEDTVDPLSILAEEFHVIGGVTYRDVGRAGGDCVCRTCSKKFYDHPMFRGILHKGEPFLVELCGRTLVKL